MLHDPRELKPVGDLGTDRDGYGRPLEDLTAYAAACLRGATPATQPTHQPTTEPKLRSTPPSADTTRYPCLADADVPHNGFVLSHLEQGFTLLPFRTTSKEEAKLHAIQLRTDPANPSTQAVYVTLRNDKFGVFVRTKPSKRN